MLYMSDTVTEIVRILFADEIKYFTRWQFEENNVETSFN